MKKDKKLTINIKKVLTKIKKYGNIINMKQRIRFIKKNFEKKEDIFMKKERNVNSKEKMIKSCQRLRKIMIGFIWGCAGILIAYTATMTILAISSLTLLDKPFVSVAIIILYKLI